MSGKKIKTLVTFAFFSLICFDGHAQTVTVSAASSLGDVFKQIGIAYEEKYPDTKVLLNVAASGVLLQQLIQGAPVDVLAVADQEIMDRAQQQHVIISDKRKVFAQNVLMLAVPKNKGLEIRQLSDLEKNQVKRIAVGNPQTVPAGRYARYALDEAVLWSSVKNKIIPVQNVRQALDYIIREEVDAGFVYKTDAVLYEGKMLTAFPVLLTPPILYSIAPVKHEKQTEEADRFIAFVLSPQGQSILTRYHFKGL